MQGEAADRMNGRAPRAGVAAVGSLIAALVILGAVAEAAHHGHPGRHRHHHQQRTTITISPGEGGGRLVHPGLFGVNHRYPYDGFGMWDPSIPGVPERFNRRFAAARFTAMRFPGGSVANTYHWTRAVGPLAKRGLNVHGRTGEPLTNEFGPDEFGRFVDDRGLEAMMLANFGTGTAREAADWVEYMNAPLGTNPNGGFAWARLRAANGHPQPYGVQNWEIGNEVYAPGQSYWMGDGSLAQRSKKYAFGGSTRFPGQRVGTPWDHRDSVALSDGSADQRFQVRYPPVDANQPFALKVGDSIWTRVADVSKMPSGAPAYELDPGTGKIRFGSGVHGAIPPDGAIIRASYRSGPHDGFVDFYREMKAADPSIKVGTSFHNGKFLSLMGDEHPYDFVVAHLYSYMPRAGFRDAGNFHDGVMRLAGRRANRVSVLRHGIVGNAGSVRAKRIPVVVSEYGMSFRRWPGPTHNYLRSMDQALYTTMQLQRWMHLGVPLAGKQSLIDFGGAKAPRGASALGLGEQALIGPAPHYLASATARAFRLITPAAGERVVRATTRGNPSRRIYTGQHLKLLRSTATKDSDGSLYLIVVNKDPSRTVRAAVAVKGPRVRSAIVKRLTGPSFLAYNTVSHPQRVSIHTDKRSLGSRRLRLRLPPHSVTTVKLYPYGAGNR
jgi:alpha-L-arabinofuranosidase